MGYTHHWYRPEIIADDVFNAIGWTLRSCFDGPLTLSCPTRVEVIEEHQCKWERFGASLPH